MVSTVVNGLVDSSGISLPAVSSPLDKDDTGGTGAGGVDGPVVEGLLDSSGINLPAVSSPLDNVGTGDTNGNTDGFGWRRAGICFLAEVQPAVSSPLDEDDTGGTNGNTDSYERSCKRMHAHLEESQLMGRALRRGEVAALLDLEKALDALDDGAEGADGYLLDLHKVSGAADVSDPDYLLDMDKVLGEGSVDDYSLDLDTDSGEGDECDADYLLDLDKVLGDGVYSEGTGSVERSSGGDGSCPFDLDVDPDVRDESAGTGCVKSKSGHHLVADLPLAVGSGAILTGLTLNPALNGCGVNIRKFVRATGRYRIVICADGRVVNVRPLNLRPPAV
jgi:hypothetical protein